MNARINVTLSVARNHQASLTPLSFCDINVGSTRYGLGARAIFRRYVGCVRKLGGEDLSKEVDLAE